MANQPDKPFRCPTCRARQALSAECRRCKCDLSLVVAMLQRQQLLHLEVLKRLKSRRHDEALEAARRLWSIEPDLRAARLLAVCYLVMGRFQAALDVYDHAVAARLCEP